MDRVTKLARPIVLPPPPPWSHNFFDDSRLFFLPFLLSLWQQPERAPYVSITAKMKYVLVSGGQYYFSTSAFTQVDRFAGVISGVGKGIIGMQRLDRRVLCSTRH